MSKHTPGPWIAKGDNVYEENEPGRIAKTCGGTDEQAAANARLIAAAPDLLEALKLQKCFQCDESEPDDEVCDACRAKRAAIAKAERGTE